MRRRIKKKKGLLKDPAYEKLKERWIGELEEEMDELEERAEKTQQEEPDILFKPDCQLYI